MLSIDNLIVNYAQVEAVRGVSIFVGTGEMVALIGANGAGKTTVLHSVMGLLKPKAGTITLKGENLVGRPSNRILDLGVALVPEGRQLFSHLTVQENLEVGYGRKFRMRFDRKGFQSRLEKIDGYFPRIGERLNQIAGTLSGGEQQMVAIARALMSDPDLLLLDEPSLGLSPLMMDTVIALLTRLHGEGMAILLIEQNARAALRISQRAYVLDSGRTTLDGEARPLLNDPRIQQAYLGL
ncbi:ABC transporter ATP-binding protein [Oryzicola mucosus]|uniref:ABC transporter ATP-binding protein n=1 Tax=Oryzicola mucosus TaxID=2767425 RepID=A0A8J6U1D0_9HYPH|nr:ABC transporter ATP-binding protein [Oryzicola mucosus]